MSSRRQAAGISQTEVPHKVTSNERPNDQLKRVDHDIADLIKRCWHATPRNRPEFEEVRATPRGFLFCLAKRHKALVAVFECAVLLAQIVEELKDMLARRSGAE